MTRTLSEILAICVTLCRDARPVSSESASVVSKATVSVVLTGMDAQTGRPYGLHLTLECAKLLELTHYNQFAGSHT